MRIAKFLFSLIITITLVYFLSQPLQLGEKNIPPIGKLVNPFSGFWANAESTIIPNVQNFNFPNLEHEVQVFYDDRMVPHIFASSTKDALFVQGYITAADRLFQMDLSTRSTAGRLSEILGERTLKRDMNKRRKGMVFAAENAVEEWKKNKDYDMLLAYCDGVNEYINSLKEGDYPLEYKLIHAKPEAWSPLKTALFVKEMASSLAERHYDVNATNTLAQFGRDTFDFLYPTYFKEQTPIIPTNQRWNFVPQKIEDDTTDNDVIEFFDYKDYERTPEFIGSNNWAVSGDKTDLGVPILCGDPHLGLSLPSIWYEMQIHTPDFNAYGVSLPGIPFIIIGFNEHIAWSQTNVGHDVADLYKIKWKDASKMEYLYDGNYKKVDVKIEEYQVKGKGTVRDTVKYTIWGPVQFESKNKINKDLAYQWLAHHGSDKNEITTFFELCKAKNFDEYYKALQTYNVPAQNYVFASKEGDIAIRVTGNFPLKEKDQGRFVRDGSKSSSNWKGFIPKDQIPLVKNPSSGYVASANQHSTSPAYPYLYNREQFEAFRGRIINRFLAEKEKVTLQDMKDFQNSNYDLKAEEALPLLLNYLDTNEIKKHSELISQLKKWDFNYSADSKMATFFKVWWNTFYFDVWDEIQNHKYTLIYPTSIRTIHLMRDVPHSIFFDDRSTPQKEDLKDIVSNSFIATLKKLGNDIPTWTKYQNSSINHLAQIPAFSRGNMNIGGVNSALNAMTSTHGPSWRQIVVLGKEMKAYVSYPGGQSGNPGSPYYDNFIDTWAEGKYYEALFMKNKDDHQRLIVSKKVFNKN